MIKLSDYVMNFVFEAGIKSIFMLAGGGCMHLVDSVGRNKELSYICNLHEQAAAIAAEAYGQYTNDFGAALVTTGPGGTNAITGVAGAWIDSTPVLIISGQVKRADLIGNRGVRQMGVQEVDIISIVRSITKYAVTVMQPEKIRYHLEKALYLARCARPGPVWIDIPLDVQSSMVEESTMERFDPLYENETDENRNHSEKDISFGITNLKEQIKNVIKLLNDSERPVILVGNGVRLSKAENIFYELIDMLDLPVLTTWKAIDMLHDSHPLYAGRPGMIGQRASNFIQQNADFIMTLGARLDLGQIGFNHRYFARAARKVVVDIDANEIKKLDMNVDVAITSDAGGFIKEFLFNRMLVTKKDRSSWWARVKEWKEKYPVILPSHKEQKSPVNIYHFIDIISDMLQPGDVIVPGSSGTMTEIFMQSFRVKAGQRIIFTPGLGSMGFGLPASIGACVASGKKRTICFNGDGGFQLNIQELETVKGLGLPIKFFVINNGGYVSIMATQKNFFEGRLYGSRNGDGLSLPDMQKVAEAYGIKHSKIADSHEMNETINDAINSPGPFICEVIASQDQLISPRVKSYMDNNGAMISMPMEDLWPFLDRDEFLSNMIVEPTQESKNLPPN